ncbi:MAG: Actin- protein 6 [Cirrosporium novae-zelandiae]|nr:MAG: Actin- protein 6 [Cirrosporium novae-zelandiae]
MPKRKQAKEEPALSSTTLVIDNGAYTMKAGFANPEPDTEKDCHIIPNCLARGKNRHVWIGAQLEKCNDFSEMVFRRPVEKGFMVNWEAEKVIWDNSFFEKNAKLHCNPRETNLILTETPNTPQVLQTNCDQIIFEDFEFNAYYRCIAPSLNAYNDFRAIFGDPLEPKDTNEFSTECMLVIDSGYSHSTVTPIFKGQPFQSAIRRLDIGGKFLTNYLKDIISVRSYNLIDDTYIVNNIKEAASFASDDFKSDLERTWKGGVKNKKDSEQDSLLVDYVLPDYTSHKHGFMKPHEPLSKLKQREAAAGLMDIDEYSVTLGNERFTGPELLFNPSDVGMKQAGLPELVFQSLSKLHPGLWPAMLSNVVVVGGNSNIKGFKERLETEIRQLAPAECMVRVIKAPDPTRSIWLGGVRLANNPTALKNVIVTREEYQEYGAGWLARKFRGEID